MQHASVILEFGFRNEGNTSGEVPDTPLCPCGQSGALPRSYRAQAPDEAEFCVIQGKRRRQKSTGYPTLIPVLPVTGGTNWDAQFPRSCSTHLNSGSFTHLFARWFPGGIVNN